MIPVQNNNARGSCIFHAFIDFCSQSAHILGRKGRTAHGIGKRGARDSLPALYHPDRFPWNPHIDHVAIVSCRLNCGPNMFIMCRLAMKDVPDPDQCVHSDGCVSIDIMASLSLPSRLCWCHNAP